MVRTLGWGRMPGVGALCRGMRSVEGVKIGMRKQRDKFFNICGREQAVE
jgi:hypothetical protein